MKEFRRDRQTEREETPLARSRGLLPGPYDIRSVALTGLLVLAIFYTIYFARAVLLPFVLALLLSYLLRPILRGFQKLRIPPAVSAGVILLSLIGAIFYVVSVLAPLASGWLEKAPYSLSQVQRKVVPLKEPIESVARASSQIEKLAVPSNMAPRTAVEVKRKSLIDVL